MQKGKLQFNKIFTNTTIFINKTPEFFERHYHKFWHGYGILGNTD